MNTPITKPRPTKDTRRPFGSQTQKLAYEPRAGYHRHWFNDLPGRIVQAQEAGYSFVEDKEGKKVHRVVGVDAAGGPLEAYLMEIPEEWYQEDMSRNEEATRKLDESIRRGNVAGEVGKDGRYVPASRGISIREGRGSS